MGFFGSGSVGKITESDLPSTVKEKLVKVNEIGDLSQLKTSNKSSLTAATNENTSQLTNIIKLKGNKINPDDYNGTDVQKLQSAIDDCLSLEGMATIELNRVYNVTGNTLSISKGDVRYPVHFHGGGIRKDDEGFIFTSEVTNSSDIYFDRVFFIGVTGAGTVVFNAEKIIRLHTSKCQFKNIDCVAKATTRHAQSIRSVNDTITGGKGFAYDLRDQVYDATFDQITIEMRESGIQLGQCQSVRITSGVLEGLSGTAIKVLTDSSNLLIQGNYFEKNKVANIDLSTMINTKGLAIKNNVHLGDVAGFSDTLIKWGTLVSSVESELNWSFRGRIHDASLTTNGTGLINSTNDYGYLENLNTARIRKDLVTQIGNKANKSQEAWKEASLLNGWINLGAGFSTARYYKDELGTVHLTGLVKSGTTGTAIFSLPEGYRPNATINMVSCSNNAICVIKIETNGDVIPVNGSATTWISLDPLNFRVI